MYLLDTSVVSELRKPKPHGAVLAWVEAADPKELYLSAVTIGEIQAGIEMTREQDITKAQQIGLTKSPSITNCSALMRLVCAFGHS
mgnify:CR=1 FL=1